MGRKRDRFWDYAEDLKGHFKCNYCKREFPGGASRIKSHLAGVKGRDILICDVVPEDVQKEAYEATQETNKKHKNASTSSKDKEGTLASTSISTIQKEKFVTQRKEEYMAEIVLDDVVDRLVTKAFSLATEHIIFKWGFKEELKNLLDTLYKIKVVLHQKRRVNDESVGIWLMELRNVAYEVDNVLDEFDYEIIWQKVQLQNQMIDQVCSFSFCSHDKVKTIKQSLDKLVNDVAGFGFTTKLLKSIIKIRLDKNEDSFLNDSEVVGREFAVLKILKELISSSNQQVISVLPIVDCWEKSWEQDVTPWDLEQPTPILLHLHQTRALPKGRALVPGCGHGYDVAAIACPERYVVGLDISDIAIKKAMEVRAVGQKILTSIRFFCAIEPDMRLAWAQRIHDILKPGGELIIPEVFARCSVHNKVWY
ncbi:putative thiol methyltransferase 2 [Quercus suber]|uniref:Thiol methyltransferase 2 n=1 Tax=Quercus suber TaxID=58331 RepID=A0AAW0L229_QUESU